MKKKIFSTLMALVLALSLSLVMAVPVAAEPDVTDVSVAVSPTVVNAEAEYTITFTVNVGLYQPGNVIIITFPDDTVVPATIAKEEVTVADLDDAELADAFDVEVDGQRVIIWVPIDIEFEHEAEVVFAGPPGGAGIVNPAVADGYCLQVNTDEEPNPVTGCYGITLPPGPVDLYLKWQARIGDCGYIYYVYVDSFDTIGEAHFVADAIFGGFSEEYDSWDLYTACPAVEDAMPIGAKIEVHPGTYTETLLIDTPGLEVVSIGDATDTIIDAEGLPPASPEFPTSGSQIAAVFISAGAVTFDGFTVMNAGVDVAGSPDADDNDNIDARGIYVWPWGEKSNRTSIQEIDEEGLPNGVWPCHAGRVNILNNIVFNSQAAGIQSEDACVLVNGNEVYDNLWDGFIGSGLFVGIEVIDPDAITDGTDACSEIIYNEFYQNGPSGMGTGYTGTPLSVKQGWPGGWTDAGIEIISACDDNMKTIYIVGNDIHDNAHAGIYLQEYATDDIVVIKFNQIVDNGVFGISTKADNPDMIACLYNNIAGNTDWGIKNWYDDDLVANWNWWNHLSGPSCGPAPEPHELSQQSKALGQGDAVSHNVLYQWWLTFPFEDVQKDLIRYHGGDSRPFGGPPIVDLVEGWNTLATPAALDERADQMGEIFALGGWMQNYVIAYSYDPVGGWDLVTGDFQLLPLEAIYVRMSAPDTLPILLRGTNWMPARVLEPGWNLVSLNAPLIPSFFIGMPVANALASIDGSWGVAISPNMPGQGATWVCTSNNVGPQYRMFMGHGYWVFVTKSTTLAGFLMAPWYLSEGEMKILDCKVPPWVD